MTTEKTAETLKKHLKELGGTEEVVDEKKRIF